ncbi:hypothetical protein [Burkholderia sp. LMG 32019]
MIVLRILRYHTPPAIEFDTLASLAYSNLPVRSRNGLEPSARILANRKRRLRTMIDELVGLGIVVRDEEGSSLLLAAPSPDGRVGGGNGNPPPPGNNAGGDGDGDGDGNGLGQVLAHPILFAYSDDDFDQALDNALERFQ